MPRPTSGRTSWPRREPPAFLVRLRELAVLGFSDIGKVVRWRPEVVYEEIEDEDNPDKPPRQVLQSRVLVLDSATLPPEVASRLPRSHRAPMARCA